MSDWWWWWWWWEGTEGNSDDPLLFTWGRQSERASSTKYSVENTAQVLIIIHTKNNGGLASASALPVVPYQPFAKQAPCAHSVLPFWRPDASKISTQMTASSHIGGISKSLYRKDWAGSAFLKVWPSIGGC